VDEPSNVVCQSELVNDVAAFVALAVARIPFGSAVDGAPSEIKCLPSTTSAANSIFGTYWLMLRG
jgi:hypothetical protein